MKSATIRKVPRTFGHVLASILSSSYLGAYRYYTLEPIKAIERHQEEILGGQLINVLVEFRRLKDEELSFVAKAATLSAAAVIGIFSWPSTEHTIWVAKMLWNWAFFMSTFSMIGSAPTRLLQHLPEKDNDVEYDERRINMALKLFLRPVDKGVRSGGKVKHRRISRSMLWVWQCPAMLMSYSWVFFLVGYALHVLSPVFGPSLGEVSSTVAIVTICGCALLVLNFAFCAGMCQYRLYGGTPCEWIIDLFRGNDEPDTEVKTLL